MGEHVAAGHPVALATAAQRLQVLADERRGAPVDIEEGRERGAARQHLYAERAGAGERIEDTRPLDAVVERRLGHGDARLAHAIGRRARHIAPLGL